MLHWVMVGPYSQLCRLFPVLLLYQRQSMTDKSRNWSWHRQSVHLTERNGLYYQKLQLLQSSQHSSMTLMAQTLAIRLHLSLSKRWRCHRWSWPLPVECWCDNNFSA